MREPGEIRRRDDGTFEYLRSVEMTLRHGYVEQWESVVEHAAKNMRLPQPFFENLLRNGYKGGPHLYDLMISEGWSAPRRDYVELQDGTGAVVREIPRNYPDGLATPPAIEP